MTAGSGTTPILELGSIRFERSNATGGVGVDESFPEECVAEWNRLLDRLDQAGGLPRFLYVASSGSVIDAGMIAVGLARSAAARGMDVLLVDLSLEAPVLLKPFPYQAEEGFTDMVLWGASLQAALRKTRDERIRLVGVGSPPPDGDEVLARPECDSVLGALRGEAEFVLGVGPARRKDGGLSPLVRKTDRTLLVGHAPGDAADLAGRAPAGRLARVGLEEEFPAEAVSPAPPERPRGEPVPVGEARRRFPVGRLLLAFALVSILVGVLFSRLYLSRRETVPVARVEEPAAERILASGRGETSSGGEALSPGPAEEAAAPKPEFSAGPPSEGSGEGTVAGGATGEDAGLIAETSGIPYGDGEKTPPVPASAGEETPGEAAAPPARTPPAEPEVAPAETVAPATEAEAPATEPYYAIHVESFPTRADAEEASGRYRARGETVTIMEKEIPGKGAWYRIVLGRYSTANDATARVEEVKRDYGLDYALAVRVNP